MMSFSGLLCAALVALQQCSTALIPPALPRAYMSATFVSLDHDRLCLFKLMGEDPTAEEQRRKLLRAELDRYDKKEKPYTTEDIDNLVPVEEWTPKELKRPPPIVPPSNPIPSSRKVRTVSTRSKVSTSDAGTLVIEITPQGISSGVLFNGAFSVAWFSAIIPATLAAMSGGILTGLFLLPFWAAGGLVAKQAVVDPFVSNKLSIGQYAWSVESLYAKNQIQKQEGSTSDLQGAKVEVPVVVNNVPQYQLCLYDSRKGVTSLGLGLPPEELEKVANDINDYLDGLSFDENGNGSQMSWDI